MKLPTGVAALLAGAVARGLSATWRYREVTAGPDRAGAEDPDDARTRHRMRPPEPMRHAVYALWHEHLLPLAMLHRESGAVALVSQHRDGEILARVLRRLGYGAARGSSTRGGQAGLRSMIELARAGAPLAITPDGPRGPARRCKPGVVRAAAQTGLPVIPMSAAADRYRRLDSWDRFLLPYPTSRIYVRHADPIDVPEDLSAAWSGPELVDREAVHRWTERIRTALDDATARCEEAAGVRRSGPDSRGRV